jgi:hypothetical protein
MLPMSRRIWIGIIGVLLILLVPLTSALADPIGDVRLDNFILVGLSQVQTQPDGTSIWSYRIREHPHSGDLRYWVLEVQDCVDVIDFPDGEWVEEGAIRGVRWTVDPNFDNGTFSLVVRGTPDYAAVTALAVADAPAQALIDGPACLPAATFTSTPTFTLTNTQAATPTFTQTSTQAATPTFTQTSTQTSTQTATRTATQTATSTVMPTAQPTATTTTTTTQVSNQAPRVTWVQPVAAEQRYDLPLGSSVMLSVEVEDDTPGARVIFRRWDAPNGLYMTIGELSSPPYQIQVPAEQFNDAWNQVNAEAVDVDGNVSESPFIWIYRTNGALIEHHFKVFITMVWR